MFQTISWQQYWTMIGASGLAYYLVVYFVYFRKHRSKTRQDFPVVTSGNAAGTNMTGLFEQREQYPGGKETDQMMFESCMDEINAFFENQKKSKPVKRELIYGLYTILQKYPALRHSQLKESLSHVIATQCEHICSIYLSAEELKGVWFG